MFNPPGAPPLPISACSGMFNAMHESFPDWEPVVVVPAQEDSKVGRIICQRDRNDVF